MKQVSTRQAVVVDDSPLVLLDACHILEEAGFKCFDANDGDMAWDVILAQDGSITLLFSDVEMPGLLNGIDLARKVAAAYPAVEIVLASGRLQPGPDELPGNTTFIAKPFSPAIVREHLRKKLPKEKMPLPLLQQ